MSEKENNNFESSEMASGDTDTRETETNTQQEIKHEATLFAEPIGSIGGFTVTNALLTSWIAVALVIGLSILIRRTISTVPSGIQSYAEAVLDGAVNLSTTVTGSRDKSLRFLPIVLPLFVFILLNNWLGLVPGVGSLGFIADHDGHQVFVPFLRGGTADLNLTLALALMAVISTHVFGVVATSIWKHFNRFVNLSVLMEMPRKVFKEKEYTAILVNPIKFFVGLIEAVGEVAKIASLSFRLFGNIFAGEVLLAAMAAIFAFMLPLPFIFLEIIVGIIQALIFAILTLVFLTVMTTDHEEHEAHS